MGYRPDIDGLRAIAIATVVVYHAFPGALPGGFIGVDVFFVISGFLISGIIFAEIKANRFSFLHFYTRRICRIFPALILVLAFTCMAGWLWLLPNDWLRLGREVKGSAFFYANFVFLNQAGYFDQAAIQKPLLHLWSLAIEEQFYLAWPLLVFLVARSRVAPGALIWIGLIGSFILNISHVAREPVATFYMPTTRAWELLVGCLLAYRGQFSETVTARTFAAIEPIVSANLRATIGLAFIAGSAAFFDSHELFPGWRALLPVLGAALVISAGAGATVNRILLANPAAVFIGLISYPLYLWHWPLLSFATIYKGGPPEIGDRALLVGVALACSIATFYLLERPIRFGQPLIRRTMAATLGVFCVAIGGAGHLIASAGITSNASRFGLDRIAAASAGWSYPTAELTVEESHGYPLRRFSGSDGPNGVLFFGDSNIEMYWPRVLFLASRSEIAGGHSIYFLTHGGCPPVPDVTDDGRPHCAGLVDAAKAVVKEKNIKTIVFGASWWSYLNPHSSYRYRQQTFSTPGVRPAAIRALTALMTSLIADGLRVYAVMNIPFSGYMDPMSMVQRHLTSFDVVPFPVLLSTQGDGLAITEALREALEPAGVKIIDPLFSLCSDGICPTVTQDGDPIYRDNTHLRDAYARSSASYIDETLR